jgi:hypothetical protein
MSDGENEGTVRVKAVDDRVWKSAYEYATE